MSKPSRMPQISRFAKGMIGLYALQVIVFAVLIYSYLPMGSTVLFLVWLSIEASVGIALLFVAVESGRSTRRVAKLARNLYSQTAKVREGIYATEVTRVTKSDVPLIWSNPYMLSAESLHICLSRVIGRSDVTIVECGSGISSQVFGYALRNNGSGKVYSLEHEKEYAGITRGYLKRSGLAEFVEVIYAPLIGYTLDGEKYQWYDLSGLPPDVKIDFVLVDGPPGSMQRHSRYPALPLLADQLSRDVSIFMDDYGRQDEKDIVKMWLENYPDFSLEEYIGVYKGGAMLSRVSG